MRPSFTNSAWSCSRIIPGGTFPSDETTYYARDQLLSFTSLFLYGHVSDFEKLMFWVRGCYMIEESEKSVRGPSEVHLRGILRIKATAYVRRQV